MEGKKIPKSHTAFIKKSIDKYRGLLLWFFVLTIIAILIAFQHFYIFVSNTELEYTLLWHLFFNLTYWWFWLAFYLLLEKMVNGIHIQTRYLNLVVFYIILPLVIVFLHQLAATAIITWVLRYNHFTELLLDRFLDSQWAWVDVVLYFIMLAGLNLLKLQDRSRIITRKNTLLQSQLYNSRFEVIKSQLRPHFLFNTLNTLSTLIIKQDNKEASRMIKLLTRFLTVTVSENAFSEITLREELQFIQDYLEIEKVRFGDKMIFKKDIEEISLNAIVPSLILQPVVENAIHHAVARSKETGLIIISTTIENSTLKIFVEDNGPGMIEGKETVQRGLGLKITKERLSHTFPNRSRIEFGKSSLGGVKVEFYIPFIERSEETDKIYAGSV